MTKFLEFFQDGDGQLSATRLGFLLWVTGVLVVWVIESISNQTLQGIPESVAAIIGVLMTGKVVQSFGENSSSKSRSTSAQASSSTPTTAPVSTPVK